MLRTNGEAMSAAATINPRIVEGLYCEALVLSDEVRAAFDLSDRIRGAQPAEDAARVALSCEALRTTTRMMHSVAWLLNHRAFFAGELNEFQLRRHGKLAEFPAADPDRLALLDAPTRDLIGATERFHARLMRLDRSWREPEAPLTAPALLLRERLSLAVGQ